MAIILLKCTNNLEAVMITFTMKRFEIQLVAMLMVNKISFSVLGRIIKYLKVQHKSKFNIMIDDVYEYKINITSQEMVFSNCGGRNAQKINW